MAKFKALTAIEHDGKPFKIGDTIELSDEHSEALLRVGAIESADK
jgi:hypothetical protein